jgi:hypothetical protein
MRPNDNDPDWSALGPLIEKYRITLAALPGGWLARQEDQEVDVFGDSALSAAFNLIVVIKEAGMSA